MLSTWRTLSEQYKDTQRQARITPTLHSVKGVYTHSVDFDSSVNGKLENSVMLTVLEVSDTFNPLDKYYQYLFNFLCYCKRFSYKPLLYIVARNETTIAQNRRYFKEFYPHVEVVDFPHELFWRMLQTKSTPIFAGRGRAGYDALFPTFEHFGGLLKMIPLLEVLQLGFNAILFDVDVAFLEDPVPYILHGDADFVATPEIRDCLALSLLQDPHWEGIEPNTGTVFVRSTPGTINRITDAVKLQIVTNERSEQRALFFKNVDNVTWTKSCDPAFDGFPHYLREQMGVSAETRVAQREGYAMKYCFLSEFTFHNGVMELACAKGRQWGVSSHTYCLAMATMAAPYAAAVSPVNDTGLTLPRNRRVVSFWSNRTLPHLFHANIQAASHTGTPFIPFPHYIQFHANYCGHKWRCLEERHLWLYHRTILNYETNSSLIIPIQRRLQQSSGPPHALGHHRHQSTVSLLPGSHPSLPQGGLMSHYCRRFDVTKTPYAHYNWTAVMADGLQAFDQFWAEFNLNEAQLVRFERQHYVYFVEYLPHETAASTQSSKRNLLLRLISNDTVLQAYAWDKSTVRVIGSPMFYLLPFGDPVNYPPPLQPSVEEYLP